ncbi:MAG: ABC transporter permease subunit [Spirochaetaceae bacterium]|jgi:NitT/TauT family transport system permease protein|nr:ABC transporter permease subunit [Spirochaetaceae bacterium]
MNQNPKRQIRRNSRAKNYYWASALIFAAAFVIYGIATETSGVLIFPSLSKIARAAVKSRELLARGIASSLMLLLPSVSVSVLLGISAGAFVGLRGRLKLILMPVFRALNPIPSTMLIPYAIALLPTFWLSSAAIITLGVFWPVLMSTLHGIAMLEPRWLDNARCLNLKGAKLVFRIILPGAMPQILSGIGSGLILSFILLTVAEIFGARSGLGYFVSYYADFAEYDRVVAGMLVLSAVVTIIMLVFDRIQARVLHWTGKR